MNLFPCGNSNHSQKPCTCAPVVVTKYQKRISGSILDRIVIHIEVPSVGYGKLSSERGRDLSFHKARVQAARDIQTRRFSRIESSDIVCNADMWVGEIRKFCKVGEEGAALSLSKCQRLKRAAMAQLNLLTRAYHRILKLARTIADLRESEEIQSVHLSASKLPENNVKVSYYQSELRNQVMLTQFVK